MSPSYRHTSVFFPVVKQRLSRCIAIITTASLLNNSHGKNSNAHAIPLRNGNNWLYHNKKTLSMKPLISNKIYEDVPENAQAIQMSPLKKIMSWSRQSMKQLNIAVVIQFIYGCIKTCCPLVCILLFACSSVLGEIKNGYEKNIDQTRESLTLSSESSREHGPFILQKAQGGGLYPGSCEPYLLLRINGKPVKSISNHRASVIF